MVYVSPKTHLVAPAAAGTYRASPMAAACRLGSGWESETLIMTPSFSMYLAPRTGSIFTPVSSVITVWRAVPFDVCATLRARPTESASTSGSPRWKPTTSRTCTRSPSPHQLHQNDQAAGVRPSELRPATQDESSSPRETSTSQGSVFHRMDLIQHLSGVATPASGPGADAELRALDAATLDDAVGSPITFRQGWSRPCRSLRRMAPGVSAACPRRWIRTAQLPASDQGPRRPVLARRSEPAIRLLAVCEPGNSGADAVLDDERSGLVAWLCQRYLLRSPRRGPPDLRQLRHPQDRASQKVVGRPPPLLPALHPHLGVLAQPGGTLVRRTDPPQAATLHPPQRQGTRNRRQHLDRVLERRPETLRGP